MSTMKVLMFGWEYPPNISGGLGTACFGLTSALASEQTQVLFVVPKLYGDEPGESAFLLNASSVPVIQDEEIEVHNTVAQHHASGEKKETILMRAQYHEETHTAETHDIIEIRIPSTLIPYSETTMDSVILHRMQRWNYVFGRTYILPQQDETETSKPVDKILTEKKVVERPYLFSGGYGATLMEEVYRYGQVGASITGNHAFDVIHVHDWMTFPAGIEAKRKSGKPLIVHVHATEHDRAMHPNPVVFAIEKKGMTHADKIIAVSQWTKKIIVEKYGIAAEKVEVVHNGIMHEVKRRQKNNADSPLGSHVVTFLGRITHQKGPDYFIDAAQKVLKLFPDAQFVMAGSGDLLPKMIERVASLKMSGQFRFTGFLNGQEIERLLSFTTVFAMPSVSEPFGITPLEAIRAGVPVVISNQSGVSEVMPHALKVDFWNSTALAAAICGLLHYKSLHKTLKKNSAISLNDITWKRAAKKVNHIYHQVQKTT